MSAVFTQARSRTKLEALLEVEAVGGILQGWHRPGRSFQQLRAVDDRTLHRWHEMDIGPLQAQSEVAVGIHRDVAEQVGERGV